MLAIAGVVAMPVAAGLVGTLLPAFGYLPALGRADLTLQPFRDLAAMPGLLRSVLLAAFCGIVTTGTATLATVLFLAGACGTSTLDRIRHILGPLMAIPHAAAAFGLAVLIAPSGLLMRLAAVPLGLEAPPDLLIVNDRLGLAMIAGLFAKELPFLLLVAFAALPQVEPERRMRLALSLGHGRVSAFVHGVWPDLYARIRLPVLAVAAYSSSTVDVALILGPAAPAPLAVRLTRWMNDPDLALRFTASAGAILQLGTTLAVILVWLALERGAGAWRRRIAEKGLRLSADSGIRTIGTAMVGAVVALLAACLLALILWSFAGSWPFPRLLPAHLTLRTWAQALGAAAAPLARTLLLGLVASGTALLLVVPLLEAARLGHAGAGPARLPRLAATLLFLPLIVPQVSFVFGLGVAALALGGEPGFAILAGVHVVFVAPYVALALADPWFRLDARFERIGASLGAGRTRRFVALRLRLLAAPMLTAFAIGFSVSIGQYLPTLLIGAGRLPTIATEAVALSAGGDRRVIGVYALLQTLLPALVLLMATAATALLHRGRRAMRGG